MRKIKRFIAGILCIAGLYVLNQGFDVKLVEVPTQTQLQGNSVVNGILDTAEEIKEELADFRGEDVIATGAEGLSSADMDIDINSLNIPDYEGTDFYVVNDNMPLFTENIIAYTGEDYIYTENFDLLGRCGTCMGQFSYASMPTEERGEIGHVKPSGWQTAKYDKTVIPDMYLYNRCHLLAFQISGLNDEKRNLITGTRQFNLSMLELENQVADLLRYNQDMKVMYRVTPLFEGTDLVAKGALMECYSMDSGESLHFCIFVYNVQDGIEINYANGDNRLAN